MEDRIVELEVRVAYQDKIIADLDDVLRVFTARIEQLQREVAELKRTVKDGTPSIGGANEKPPHY
ncbi:MAG: SlyX family protein [Deltaproteobacteria bacterium]|nr:SlyX family protein [Deltaproteobacteria bacterium]